MRASWAFQETGNDADRRRWQRSMLSLLHAYSAATGLLGISREISLYWEVVNHLSKAFQSIVDGKDADLFEVSPSDQYGSTMRLAIELAVSYVNQGTTKEDQQNRKRLIMTEYGIARSTLNEWIKNTKPNFRYNDEEYPGLFSDMSDYYKKYKLIGSKRKP